MIPLVVLLIISVTTVVTIMANMIAAIRIFLPLFRATFFSAFCKMYIGTPLYCILTHVRAGLFKHNGDFSIVSWGMQQSMQLAWPALYDGDKSGGVVEKK